MSAAEPPYGPHDSEIIRHAVSHIFEALKGTKATERIELLGLDVALVAGFALGALVEHDTEKGRKAIERVAELEARVTALEARAS